MNKKLTELKFLTDFTAFMLEDDFYSPSDDIPTPIQVALQEAHTSLLRLQVALMEQNLLEMSTKTD